MKECQIHQNSKVYKICSICNKAILDINLNFIHNSKQREKIKENLKYIQPSEFIKICICKNLKKDINNDYNLYAHKYCILLKIIYLLEIKCEKCNTAYNIKINKKIDLKRKLSLFVVFLLIYIIHLLVYLFGIMLFVGVIFKKFSNIKKYNNIIYFSIAILLIINSFILYFSIVNNIVYYKYIYNYTINILDTSKFEITNKYYKLISDYFKWFYGKSKLLLLIYKHKNYIINKSINISHKEINAYIKENNKENKILKNTLDKISENNNKSKISLNINSNNINNTNNSNILTLQNAPNNVDNENELQNPFDKFILNKKEEVKIENNINTNNDLLDLYSDKSDNNNEDNKNNNNDINAKKKNLIDMTSINKFNKDYINININPIQANNINININFNDLNTIKDIPYNNEKNELSFHPSKLHDSTGKTALIPNKNLMNKIMDDNTHKNYLKQRRQIKSIKLKQKDIKIKDTKIIGNIEENEEIDFSEFEKGKMDSKISKNTKGDKLYFLKSIVEGKDLFTTKKSYKDVPLNISNPTDSVLYDDRFSMKNNIISKNANYSNSNLFHYIKK